MSDGQKESQDPPAVSQERHSREERDPSAQEGQGSSSSRKRSKSKKLRKRKYSSSSGDSSPETPAKRGKKKKHKKAASSSSSSSESSSSSSGESDSDDAHEYENFEIVSEKDMYKWKLPKGLAKFVNKHFEEYIPDSDLKDQVLTELPIPANIDSVKKLDDFLKDLLKEKRKFNEQNLDNIFEKFQQKILDAMGPLSKLWSILAEANKAKEDTVQISVAELLQYVDKTIITLGASSNNITYHRRLNVLGSIMNSQYQVKTMLKEKAELLQKHDNELFGKKFRNYITKTLKAKKETKEIFEVKKPFSHSQLDFSHRR